MMMMMVTMMMMLRCACWEEDEDVYIDVPLADTYAEVVAASTTRTHAKEKIKPPSMPTHKFFSLAQYGKSYHTTSMTNPEASRP